MASMLYVVTLVLALVMVHVTTLLACNGYELVVNKLHPCNITNQTASVTLHNFSVFLTEDCKLMTSGCISYIAYNNLSVSYLVKKRNDLMPPYIFKKVILGCMERGKISQEILDNMSPLRSLTTCPVTADKICSGKNTYVDLSKYFDTINRAEGRIVGQVDIAFNSGNSCFKFDATMQKWKKKNSTANRDGSEFESPDGQNNNNNNNPRPPAGQNNGRPPQPGGDYEGSEEKS